MTRQTGTLTASPCSRCSRASMYKNAESDGCSSTRSLPPRRGAFVYIWLRPFVYLHKCTRTHAHTHMCRHTHTHTPTHTRTHAHTPAHSTHESICQAPWIDRRTRSASCFSSCLGSIAGLVHPHYQLPAKRQRCAAAWQPNLQVRFSVRKVEARSRRRLVQSREGVV
jgi:hypothetical protein